MSQNCIDPNRVAGWCAAIPGESLEERRSELLWQYVRAQVQGDVAVEIRQHLDSCEDCRGALDAERLLAEAASTRKVAVATCPSHEELLQYQERDPGLSPFRRLEIKRHLDRCPQCREEAGWAARRVMAGEPGRTAGRGSLWTGWLQQKWPWVAVAAAAMLAVVMIYPSQFGARRFARYAQIPDVPYELVLAEFGAAHPAELPKFRAAAQLVSLGEYDRGEKILAELEKGYAGDPSIVFLRGYIALRGGRWHQATLLCRQAERHSLDGFRCWYLANVALKAGDLELARQEIRHAQGHALYKELATRLEKQVD